MSEEHEWQLEPTTRVPCANNCGFVGSPTTLNLCSKCYKDHCLKEQQMSTAIATIAVENSLTSSTHESKTYDSVFTDCCLISGEAEVDMVVVKPRQPNRCASCKKCVRLTGFTCRCGTMFCGSHRYPEKHDCMFDYKTVGKEAIARENPVVKGVKLEKI